MKLVTFVILSLCLLSIQKEEFAIGSTAPLTDYQMKSVEGKLMSLAEAKKDKGIIVVFSCNTCPFVVGNENFDGWEKQYNKFYNLAKNAGMNFILVNSNEAKRDGDDSFENMKEHAEKQAYQMDYLLDENAQLANAFGAKTTPHVFMLDESFKLIYKGAIDNSWDSKRTETLSYLENAIKEYQNAKTITNNSTEPRGCSIKRTK